MNKHVHYFDHIRLIAAISVIYMHVAAGPLRAAITLDWHFMNVTTSFAFTAVPLFFMMSGYLLLSNQKTEDISVLLKKRLPRLLVPLFAWTVVALLWFFVNDRSPANFIQKLIASIKSPAYVHFWYVYTLVAIYILSPVICAALRVLDKKAHIFIFVIALIPSVHYILRVLLPPSLDRFIDFDVFGKLTLLDGHLNTFVLGYFIGNYKKKIPNWLLALSGVILLALISAGTYHLTVKNGYFDQTFQVQSQGFEVLLAAVIFLFFKQNFNRETKFYRAFPVIPLAFSIYFMHNILLSVMATVLQGAYSVKTFGATLAVTFVNLAICFVVMKTVATIKPFCFLATGISYKSACKSCNWIYTYDKVKTFFANRKR